MLVGKNESSLDRGFEVEKCIICGFETKYIFSTPIDQRTGYIEGMGQLCTRCYLKYYLGSNCGEEDPIVTKAFLLSAKQFREGQENSHEEPKL